MFKSLRWKIPLIFAALLGSIWLAYPLDEKIRLGLDLQGGMHLVLEVQVDKALEASLDRVGDDIRRSAQEEDLEVDHIRSNYKGYQLKIQMVDALDFSAMEKILTNYDHLERISVNDELAQMIYAFTDREVQRVRENAVDQGLETIRNRVDEFGVAEPSIQRQGEERILIQLPGIKDTERAINLIGKTARLEFKLVDETLSVRDAQSNGIPEDDEILYEREINKDTGEVSKKAYLVRKRAVLTGETLTAAEVRYDTQFNEPYVSINFNSYGSAVFHRVTRENVKKHLAIVLDDHVYSAPVIQEAIAGGRAQVTGSFTSEEARDLAIVLRAGALPAPVTILENRTVGPSLGKDSIEKGVQSVLLGSVFVVFFIVVYYKLSGVVADIALALNMILMMGALSYFGASLTLPGIAGILLTVGMAIDANVLIFERVREEIRIGKTVRAAIDAGFAKAFRTIVDANVTTFIAAIVLFQFGTGPIKGFAITLCIGILASMFTAVFVSRAVFDSTMSQKKISRLSI